MSSDTFDCLDETQRGCLVTLGISNYSQDIKNKNREDGTISGIESFSFSDLDGSLQALWLANIFYANYDSLEHVCLGAEPTALDLHNRPNADVPDHTALDFCLDAMTDKLKRALQRCAGVGLADTPLLIACKALELKALNISKLIKPGFLFQDWRCLGSLTFYSCLGVEQTLTLLANEKNQQVQPFLSELRLHSLHVRHEYANQEFKAQLRGFITSLPGLVNLSVLLQSNGQPLELTSILMKHGKTLRTLVLEDRRRRRLTFAPSRGDEAPSMRQLRHVSYYCRHLVELGIALDWEGFTEPSSFPGSVRNFPTTIGQVCSLH